MSQTDPRVATDDVEVAFARRRQAGRRLGAAASDIAATCAAMAERFREAARSTPSERAGPPPAPSTSPWGFVHPVIVGKRALPAHSLVSDAATVLGRTTFGGHRMIDMLVGDPLPRIC
jgi:D-sedoheptulose 7-phosphate isomerase